MSGYGQGTPRGRAGRGTSGAPTSVEYAFGRSLPHGDALSEAFYLQPTLRVARQLLGKLLVHEISRASPQERTQGSSRVRSIERLAGRIVEVEAYCGVRDRAAHSYGGHRSQRNEAMYGPAGRAYVYLIYGVHHCLNVVCRPDGIPEAVLIRAVDPIDGVATMARHRRLSRGSESVLDARDRARLCRGPGCVCRAFGIDRRLDGADLVRGSLRVLDADAIPPAQVGRSPRVGVGYAGVDAGRRWRFFIVDNPCVSCRLRSL